MNGRIVIVDKPVAEQAVESMFGISVGELAKRIVSGQIKVLTPNERETLCRIVDKLVSFT